VQPGQTVIALLALLLQQDLSARRDRVAALVEEIRGAQFPSPVVLREGTRKEYAHATTGNAQLVYGDLGAFERGLKALGLIGGALNLQRTLQMYALQGAPAYIAKGEVALLDTSVGDDEIAFRLAVLQADQRHGHTELAGRIGPSFDAQMALAAARQGVGDMTKQLVWARKKRDERHAPDHLAKLIAAADTWERETSRFASMVAPRLFVRAADFSYRRGGIFMETVRQAGGMSAVDQVLARPPSSTEQVLHVEKYVAGEEPAVIDAKPLDDALAAKGYARVWSTTLGELGIAIVLETHVKEDVSKAARGWAGDLLCCYEDKQKRTLVAWLTAWDTREDAAEFEAAARKVPGARVLRRGWGAAVLLSAAEDLPVWKCTKRVGSRDVALDD
jgi:hypothetical protein